MKSLAEKLRERRREPQEVLSVQLNLPKSAVEDMDEIAPCLGFGGHISLMRWYISSALRKDLARLDGSEVQALSESLRKRGVSETDIQAAIEDAGLKVA